MKYKYKDITQNKLLKIKSIENFDDTLLKKYKDNSWICTIKNDDYFIIKRHFDNNYKRMSKVELDNAICSLKQLNEITDLEVSFGDQSSFIVDMNGIDNFRFAKSLVFNDYDVRKIVLKLGLLDDCKYLRYGCSGARDCNYHPGGEVFEYCIINGKDGSGISQSVSGYLPVNKEYSKSISLFGEDTNYLREERIVYSHTAFLKENTIEKSNSISFKIKVTKNSSNLLDIIDELTHTIGLNSYSIQMRIKSNNNTSKLKTTINGRVLRHMPKKAFKVLQEATDIGLEQLFELKSNDIMYGVGTKYDRYEPEWKEFTGGRQYERRGHIHCTIVGDESSNKHEVFHLRDAFLSPSSDVEIVLNPISTIYRIYPIYKKNNNYYCKSSDKNIEEF